jgi:hypothetical protein
MPDETAPDASPSAAGQEEVVAYVYKPSLMGAAWELSLEPDALAWRTGGHQGRIPYDRITRVRLSFRPVTMQSRRFVTEIWWAGGPRLVIASTSWRSLVEQEAQDRPYGAFVRALHRRLAAAGTTAAFETGSPAALYWPGLAMFAGVAVALAALTVRALQIEAYAGAALVGGFLALFLWQSGMYFRRNRPGRYHPDAVPKELVPDG